MDDESSEDDEAPTEAMRQKRQEMDTWVKFCKAKIDKIEKVWNKKLEDSTNDDDDQTGKQESAEDEDSSREFSINQLLENFNANRLARS